MSFLNFADYLAKPRPPESWIVKDILPVGGSATIYGRGKIGKSWAALGMAIAVSQGKQDWLGFPVHTHGLVAYIQVDVSGALWYHDYFLPIAPFVKDPTTFFTVDKDVAPRPFNIFGAGGQWLKRSIAELPSPPLLTIVDTLRKMHTGDENDSGHSEHVMSALVDAIPGALLIITHARKANQLVQEDVLDDVRGSTAFTGGVDAIVKIASNRPREKGVLLYESRTNSGRVLLKRDPCGLWLPAETSDEAVGQILSTLPSISQNAQAAVLAERLGISHRTAVRRLQEYLKRD